ncbi:sensor histidine kinase [Cellulomonas alba]|uniref:histidine kinase n=1 Tax=Cellulomonas alba TaxID=3053467 RepID=A0ABT7SCD3_9CELL|nr:HAMP domain-containing sensor histidine kinase [Cellulomonas alba]MDM7853845.1 HAMP domain-containing sensor histidine kinase [Cellulomonas alba]
MSGRSWSPGSPRAWGLRARIVTTAAVLTAVGMAALVAITALVLDRANDANVRGLLEDRAQAVAAASVAPDGSLGEPQGLAASDEVAWIFDASGAQVHGPAGSDLDHAAARLATVTAPATAEPDGWLLYAEPLPRGAGAVVVGSSLRPYESTRDTALLVAGALGVLVVGSVTAMSAWTVTRALRPVTSMARSAAAWSEQDLDRRFDLGPPHDEITELGAVLDALLGRVARALVAEQRLTSELAHELRTPLTVVRAEAELALRSPALPADEADRLERIVAATDHLASVIDALLSAARGASSAETPVPVDEVLAAAASVASTGRLDVDLVVAPAGRLYVATPVDVAARALSPLVANALRYARTAVTVAARDGGAVVEIEVRDDGPGVDPGRREDVFVPGRRSVESPGAGLGLPLARRVARGSGGDVQLAEGSPTRFVLTLPKAARPPRD